MAFNQFLNILEPVIDSTQLATQTSCLPDSLFFGFTNCEKHSGGVSLNTEVEVIDLKNDQQIEALIDKMKLFLSRGNQRVIFLCDQVGLNWQRQAELIYRLLSAISGHPMRLVIAVNSANSFAEQLLASILSLNTEQGNQACCILQQARLSMERAVVLFDTCFDQGANYYYDTKPFSLSHWAQAKTSDPHILLAGRVLLVGGSGGIGRELTRHLTLNHRCQVFIVSRRTLSPDQQTALALTGAKAFYTADVSDHSQIHAIYQYINEKYGDIDYIYHLAGTYRDSMFQNKSEEDFINTIKPKMAGAQVIKQLADEFQPKSVTLFSSLSSIVGNSGQTDYAAANAYLDCMVKQETNAVVKWRVINWGLWQTDGGMQMDEQSHMSAMPADEALAAHDRLLASQGSIYAIYKGDPTILVNQAKHQTSQHRLHVDASDTLKPLAIHWVNDIVIKRTKFRRLDQDDNLLDLGVDSIIATHIATRIQQQLNQVDATIVIPQALLFEYSSVVQIAQYLIGSYSHVLSQLLTSQQQEVLDQPTASIPKNTTKQVQSAHVEGDQIAIVAMAGEFPDADDICDLWKALESGESLIKPIPASRWDWRRQHGRKGDLSGNSYCRHGGFINHAKEFDNAYFNITQRDAIKLDPQIRRLLHQTTYALEQVNGLQNDGEHVGVFTSAMYSHYQDLSLEKELVDSSFSAVANYISHYFGFDGPSLCVDTMCSGGLTALHMAMNSLRLNHCQAAVVAAVNIMPNPNKYRFLSEHNFLSPTGKCHSFGIAADGYVPGEGVVVLALKRLSEAERNGDHVYGIVRGSAINSVGKGSQLTVPSAKAQASVISQALKNSRLHPQDISLIETHGTGTELGDPIEIDGLNRVFLDVDHPISVSAIKSNIGHLEAAAGLAGVVKVLLQMHYQTLVPSVNCRVINPHLDLHNSPLQIQRSCQRWGDDKGQRFAGVSAFGAGGSNAHVIIQSPPAHLRPSLIPKPKHQFNSSTFWLDFEHSGKTMRTKEADPVKSANNVFYTSGLQHVVSPLVPLDGDTTLIYICHKKQVKAVKESVNGSSAQVLDITEISKLKKLFERQSSPACQIVNLTSLEAIDDVKRFSQQQFEHAKLLATLSAPISYVHAHPKDVTNLESLIGKASVMCYHSLALEHNNITLAALETDAELLDLCQLLSHQTFKRSTQPIHYCCEQEKWSQRQLQELQSFTNNTESGLLKLNGVYIITGGLGAIGGLICKLLLARYHANVICLGRSELTGEKLTLFNNLNNVRPTIDYYQVDINDQSAVLDVVKRVQYKHGKINGVIHSACVLNDKLLKEKPWHEFYSVLACKITGTINLFNAIKSLTLDFFALFSSISSIYGNVGQTDYTMANRYLDEFANYFTQGNASFGHTKVLSINWPIWSVEGLAINDATVDYICESLGIDPLSESAGGEVFEKILASYNSYGCVTPLHGDTKKIRLRQQQIKLLEKDPSHEATKKTSLTPLVISLLAEVVKANISSLNEKTSINALGMSSVLLTEFATKIEQALGIVIAPSAFFSYNTIEKIVAYLEKKNASIVHSPEKKNLKDPLQTASNDDNRYAIIGISFMLPHGEESESYWDLLVNNRSAVRKVGRWKDKSFFAATLDDIAGFDNKFFNLSNREAMLMDPQHRLFLQVAYDAFINAGCKPSAIKNTGVFVGVQFNDYQTLVNRSKQHAHPYSATGNSHAMLANRVSYMLDLHGPSQTIDTACSSTFVAINRGLHALKNQECDMILAGAVSLLIDPNVTEAAQSMGVLSEHHRCATFDKQADGYVRGEGVGAFVIKRLSDALRDKDAIHAIIESCAENHGGRANSLTSPNPLAQRDLLLKAYTPELARKVSYIETHGTGTKLGDPVEVDALTQAFKELVPDAKPGSVTLGAVKTNVGHLEPAAGVPSLIKAILSYHHHCVPTNINFNSLNPYISFDNTPFQLANKNIPFNNGVIGISSFGFGGSNTHLVLSAPPTQHIVATNKAAPIVLSAKSHASLDAMKAQLATFLKHNQNTPLECIAYTLGSCREHFDFRFATMADTVDDLIRVLDGKLEPDVNNNTVERYLNKAPVEWKQLFSNTIKCHLPGYAFDNKHFWLNIDKIE